MTRAFIASACRTAIGSFGGGLAWATPVDIGKGAAEEALARAGLTRERLKSEKLPVGECIVGNVLGAGHGMNIARQVALGAGLHVSTPAYTVNKVCGSGLKAVALAASEIQRGEYPIALAGGVESMSAAAYVSLSSRFGARLGHAELKDLLLQDGLTDAFHGCHMGVTAENLAERFGIGREAQDAFALESQKRAAAADAAGNFKPEIVSLKQEKRGKVIGTFEKDEFIKADSTIDALAKLRPAFKPEGGTVTAGNASGINDGAAFLVLCSEEAVTRFGLKPRAEILGWASSGVEPEVMGLGPVGAVKALTARTGIALKDFDLVEANEAFAVQALAVSKELELDPAKTNVWGGAIALGHPIGASGARILVTLVHQLEKLQKKQGIATLCVGGGQGIALGVRRV